METWYMKKSVQGQGLSEQGIDWEKCNDGAACSWLKSIGNNSRNKILFSLASVHQTLPSDSFNKEVLSSSPMDTV